MKRILRKIIRNRDIVDIWIIFLVNLIISIPLLLKNTNIYVNEGADKLIKAYETYKTILRNQNTNIISEFANGFGYSINLFSGNLSIYLIIFFSLIVNYFNVGLKIVMFLIELFSGLTMYKMMQEITEKRNIALLSSIVYITSPYFFNNEYARCSVDDSLVFVFIPLVFLGLYNLFNTEKRHYYLIIGLVGILLSSNVFFTVVLIFCLIYMIINLKEISSTRVKKGLLIDFIFVVILTMFYWVPLLQAQISSNYEIYNNKFDYEEICKQTVNLKNLFVTPNGSVRTYEIGLPIICMLVFSLFTYRKLNNYKKEYLFCIISRNCFLFYFYKIFSQKTFIFFSWISMENA